MKFFPKSGPVAQLGARFHGMEEVIGSIPIRSTNHLQLKVSFGDELSQFLSGFVLKSAAPATRPVSYRFTSHCN